MSLDHRVPVPEMRPMGTAALPSPLPPALTLGKQASREEGKLTTCGALRLCPGPTPGRGTAVHLGLSPDPRLGEAPAVQRPHQ